MGPVFQVKGGELWIIDDQQIFGVLFFGCLGEIEGTREDKMAVDHHDFVMGDGMFRIDQDGNSFMGEEIG